MQKETQLSANIITAFWTWYFLIAPKNIVEIWFNYLKANLHFFSVMLLLRTLFAPWHRDRVSYGRGFDFKRYLEIWSLNMVARTIGFIIRAVTLVIALGFEVFFFSLGVIFLAFWILAPISLTAAFLSGFILLF